MNVALILLIIVILVLVLYLVYYVGFSSQVLLDLSKADKNREIVANKEIANPSATSFTYSMWVYVNSWSNGIKEICKSQVSETDKKFRIYLDSTSPTLKTDISTTDTSSPIKTVTITNNFPVQRWVYIVVSVEGSVVDCYLDGKLVKSQQLQFLPKMGDAYSIKTGEFDAFITKFNRFAAPTDPQTAWNNYMAGNGFAASSGPAYGFSFVVTKDQSPIAKYQYQ